MTGGIDRADELAAFLALKTKEQTDEEGGPASAEDIAKWIGEFTETNRPAKTKSRTPTGIEARHQRSCGTHSGGRCNCSPTWRAWVYDKRSKTSIRKSFTTLVEAKRWRSEAADALYKGRLGTPTKVTVSEAAKALLEGMEDGSIRTKSGLLYRPAVIRNYRAALEGRIIPAFGPVKLSDLTRRDVQALADRLLKEGLDPSSVRNLLMPLRTVYRRALQRGDVAVSPMVALELPAATGRRERVAGPEEARELIAALMESDRALWGVALFAGLRRGELRGMRWSDIDLAAGVIYVRRSMNSYGEVTPPKSEKGERRVPIIDPLRELLEAHQVLTGRTEGLVFGTSPDAPFTPTNIRKRALTAWRTANVERAKRGLEPLKAITLHECRHSAVTLFHEAGLTLPEIGDLVGHTSQSMSDRYRHLRDGRELELGAKVNAYLALANTKARLSQLDT